MEQQKIEIMGIVKPNIERNKKEWGAEECEFELECSFIKNIYCPHFIPHIRKGWKVRVIGTKKEGSDYIYAESVEVIKDEPPKQKGEQLKLGEFEK